jgi:hypothetical protein
MALKGAISFGGGGGRKASLILCIVPLDGCDLSAHRSGM